MTHQLNTGHAVRRLKSDAIDLLARDLDCGREEVFSAVISNGRGKFRLLVSEDAELESAPREGEKPTTLENVAHLVLEIATLQKRAIGEHKQLSRFSMSPLADGQQSERYCEEIIDPTTGDIDHRDSRAGRRK